MPHFRKDLLLSSNTNAIFNDPYSFEPSSFAIPGFGISGGKGPTVAAPMSYLELVHLFSRLACINTRESIDPPALDLPFPVPYINIPESGTVLRDPGHFSPSSGSIQGGSVNLACKGSHGDGLALGQGFGEDSIGVELESAVGNAGRDIVQWNPLACKSKYVLLKCRSTF